MARARRRAGQLRACDAAPAGARRRPTAPRANSGGPGRADRHRSDRLPRAPAYGCRSGEKWRRARPRRRRREGRRAGRVSRVHRARVRRRGFVLTDSGGVQEETSALGVPCFTLREDSTERPVTVELGTNTILGAEPERIREIPGLPLVTAHRDAHTVLGRPRRRKGGGGARRVPCSAGASRGALTCAALAARWPSSNGTFQRHRAVRHTHARHDGRTAARTARRPGSRADRRVGSAIAGCRSSICRDGGEPADGERGRLAAGRLQRRDLQPRRDPRELEASAATLEDRPLRHRGDPARVRAVGHRLPAAVPRHVRVRRSGTRAAAQLWLVRDRIGIKPLYYSVHHGRLDVRV